MGDQYTFDLQILFDEAQELLSLKVGEKVFYTDSQIEDAKGNAGSFGVMQATNARIIWISQRNQRINLSIGFGCIFYMDLKTIDTLSDFKHSIIIRTKHNNSRFEFLFTGRTAFSAIKSIYQSYERTSMHRNIKVNTSLMAQRTLIIQTKETLINKYNQVFSVQQDKSDISGTLILTNIRWVWVSSSNELFNISIPWIAVKKITKKTLKTGQTAIIETHSEFGGYIVGYRYNDIDQLIMEITKLQSFYQQNPVYGVEYSEKQQILQQKIEYREEVEILDTTYNSLSGSAYKLDRGTGQRDIVNSELGIAIEKLPPGQTMNDLWNIMK